MENNDETVVEETKVEETKATQTQTTVEETKPEAKTFTQEQVNAMMAREKKQGEKAALTKLGFKDEKSAKSTLDSFSKFIESQKTEEEKSKELISATNQEKIDAENRATMAEAKLEAIQIGVKPDCVDDIIALAMSKKTDTEDFKTVIEGLKTKYPSFFTATSEDGSEDENKSKGKKGTGGVVKNTETGADKKSIGARLAEQRKTSANKSSFFKN